MGVSFGGDSPDLMVTIGVALITSAVTAWLSTPKLNREHKFNIQIEKALQELLSLPNWKKRSFRQIREKVPGLGEDELRRALIRTGAVAFRRKTDAKELWGLRNRKKSELIG
jgi:hypothetical protein